MTRSLAFFVVVVGSLAPACFGAPPDGGGGDPLEDPECQLDTEGEKSPGFPYDVETFTNEVMPIMSGSCALGGCHGAPTGSGGFTVWKDALPGDCNFGKTFNNVVRKIDLSTPANSRIVAAVSGGSATHPFSFATTAAQLNTLRSFVDDAAARFEAEGGGVTPPPGPSPFNYDVYQTTIQPAISAAGCATAGCHGTAAGGFSLKGAPPSGSADMEANFIAITSRTNLETPPSSTIYVRATVRHGGGMSTQVTPEGAAAMLAWIEDAKQNAGNGGGGGGNPTCAPVDKFNVGVFRSEILPILAGDLDLNVPGGQGRGAGCMSGACHGTARGPGALSLEPTADPATLLQNFACFVNLAAPSNSEILACPLDDPRCRRYPHPGQDVLQGANDLNYQRLLAFIYGAKVDVSPLDFAFFVRRINPIFNDNLAVENGAQNRSCSDATACHGVSIAGQSPPNGSDFPIIPNASDVGRLSFNFVAATGFVSFLNPGQSSLFLYPTDEIANRDNPLATGLPHPGGRDFEVDSDFAQAILQWAGGLRPDGNGLQRNWLVVGDFAATRVSDQTLLDETTVAPQIFELGGGAFNRGEWDGLFSDRGEIDLNVAFPRAATSGRVAYAVSYAINTVPRQLTAQLTVTTNNPIRIYVDGLLVAQNDQGGGATALLNLPPAAPGAVPKRIMIKVLQRANDARFAFTAQLRDELGTLLTDRTGELVFTLGPKGGI